MTLIRRGAEPGDPAYSGPGQIRQSESGSLDFTLYDEQSHPSSTEVFPTTQPGEWVKENHFFDLTAKDWRGREWSAYWIIPDVSGRMGEQGIIVRGSLEEVTCRRESKPVDKSFVRMAMLGKVRILTTGGTETITRRFGREGRSLHRNVWVIEDDAATVEILRSDLGVDVSWASLTSDELPKGIDTRIEEAIWLLTFQPLQWFLLEEASTSGHIRAAIRARRDYSINHRLVPPIAPNQVEAAPDASDLFLLFLGALQSYPESGYHPVTAHLRRVIQASALTIQDEALALGVAVERILRDRFGELAKAPPSIKKAVDDLLGHLGQWSNSPEVLKRAEGCIRQIKGPSPRQALKKLVANGMISVRHMDAWVSMRNAAAHGFSRTDDIEKLVDECDLVRELYILLIARWLDYQGRLTRVTEVGYPLVSLDDLAEPH